MEARKPTIASFAHDCWFRDQHLHIYRLLRTGEGTVPVADDLEYARTDVYEDDTLVRVSVRRTADSAYPSG
jgi:hypothetical protein